MRKILFALATPILFTLQPLLVSAGSTNIYPLTSPAVTEMPGAETAFLLSTMLCTCIFPILMGILVLGGLVIVILMIIDVFRRDFGTDQNQEILWVLILLFFGFPVGIILYYYLGMKKYPKKK